MHSKWLGRIGLAALVLGVTGSSGAMVGCAAERDPINRVQLNAIPKSFLVGEKFSDPSDDPEFYARTMVIDVPYGESGSDFLMFTNTINSVSKIKWSFEGENGDSLVGRVSFERIEGTDGKGLTPTAADRDTSKPLAQNSGIPVYQFRVISHFDIRRSYNPGTGEEQNVIEENTTDRPWTERDYVRVDFSENHVNTAYDFDTLSLLGLYNAIQYTSSPIFVENPNDANAPVIDTDTGYFDVTNKVFAAPKEIDLGGWSMPGCMLPNIVQGGTAPTGNCNPNELTLRHSFRKVVDKDYEPVNWDGQRFETYGAFLTERQGYARDYGLVDSQWKRYISRYNIWERSHWYKDAENMKGEQKCVVDDDCAELPNMVSGMSHCDVVNNKCTLPYRDRVAKPIVWHYSDKSPELYYEATREAAEDWDTAMRVAVFAAKYAECKRFSPDQDCGDDKIVHGNWSEEEDAMYLVKEINACKRGEIKGTAPEKCDALAVDLASRRGYSDAVVKIAQAPQMVILCHGPVSDKDPEVCGKPGTVARLGDLRFNLVTNVEKPETNSPWGIMSDGNDPLTGEKVASSINVWTHVNDLFSRGLVDTLRYIGGELQTSDITEGKYVEKWVEAARQTKGGLPARITADERDKRIAAVAGTTVDALHAAENVATPGKYKTTKNLQVNGNATKLREALVANLKKVAQTKAAWDAPSVNAPIYQARANLVKGSPLEAQAITPAMQQLAQSSYGGIKLDLNQTTAATSIFQGLNPQIRRQYEQRLENALASRGACVMQYEATAPLGYIDLKNVLEAKFGAFNAGDPADVQAARADKMKDYIRRRAQYAVISHEMGHSFALRHNFVGSSDPWNYRPQYWQLRTNDKALSNTFCDDTTQDGASCVGPRWQDPVTDNEARNMIHMWSHSTTMDYAGEPSQDLLGLGVYDFGAARMFYGDVATVYEDARFNPSVTAGKTALSHQNDFGGLLGFRFGPSFTQTYHYSQLDAKVNLIESCQPVDVEAFKPLNWNADKDGEWHNVLDGHIVTNEQGVTTKCTQPRVDFVQWDELQSTADKTHAFATSADGSNRTRVPHAFASDDWADLGNIAVFRHDAGGDLFETMHFWIAQQEMNHIFTSYRRGRRDFSVWGAFNRTLSRYHEKMRDSAKAIGLYVTLARDTVSAYGAGDTTDPQAFVAEVLKQVATDSTVASSIAFDHFTHVYARPQPGAHGPLGSDPVLRWQDDGGSAGGFASGGTPVLSIANGVTGGFGTISLAGRPIENALANNMGRDYDRDYTLNVGSYYEKAFTAMLFAESADNFISSSRDDFVDPRFRAVALADVFPDGFRRWFANNLTNDDQIKGVYVRGQGTPTGPSAPELDDNGYALVGQTSWWPTAGIETCFPQGSMLSCRDPFATTGLTNTGVGAVIDPQVGWEQQKFAILFTLLYIPENQRSNWLDQMRIYELGTESDPGFDNRIEFHDPDGKIYVAKTFGTETLYGKTVQKGIAARTLEYANELLRKGVVTAEVKRGDIVVGYAPVLDVEGKIQYLTDGKPAASCANSAECTKMKAYVSVPNFLREAQEYFGFTRIGGLKGVY